MSNLILEMLKKPFLANKQDNSQLSSVPDIEDIDQALDDVVPTGFYDEGTGNVYMGGSKKQKNLQLQNEVIKSYRRIAATAEVSEAINEIVDEAIFSPGNKDIINMDFNGDIPQEIKDRYSSELKDITNKINLDKNIYSMFLQFYIDGQLNIHCAYDYADTVEGILKLKILSPYNLAYNYTTKKWSYESSNYTNTHSTYGVDRTFTNEEIIRIDSGIYSDNLILSNLHTSIKTANMLTTLEDMLIPMRFSRSVSRRVFNIDVANLNNKKAEEVMKKVQAKFKYRKFYNLETGTISNQQHVSSLTEDYWFPNRDGSKGTTVDTLDETGNLGEIEDILYFKRKLYSSLKIPTNRITTGGDASGEFSFTADSISREEMKFFNFVTRLRNNFLDLFYELLKRQVISKGISNEQEWGELRPNFKIKFVSENKFYESMEQDRINSSLDLYNNIEDLIEKGYFSHTYVYKKVLKLSDEEIKNMAEEIEKEKSDPLYKRLFDED